MLNSENAILERKNYRILSSSTVRLTSLFENQYRNTSLTKRNINRDIKWGSMHRTGPPESTSIRDRLTTASRRIAIFAKEKGKISGANDMRKPQETASSSQEKDEIAKLQARVKELEAQLLRAEIKAEAYDEMINVAEAKFRIPIRKKAGAKQ